MRTIFNKKNLSKLLLFFIVFVFVAGAVFNPIGAESVSAAEVDNLKKASEGLKCYEAVFTINMDQCIALIGYGAFFVPSNWLLSMSGSLFDAMVAFSLSSDVMNQPFVMTAWEAVRDVANMAFIFVLLYIAIATILGLGNYKKLLVNLVIVALIINFSAFFTKIVIDASNILALGFYNAIEAPAGDHIKSGGGITIIPESRISTAFVAGFNPQVIAGNDAYKDWTGKGKSASSLFFVFLAAGIVQVVAAFTLFAAGFLFLGRLVAFIFLIIASPIAFVAFILPGASGLFKKWLSTLTNQALVAPVFLFFMYIIALIVQSNFLGAIFQSADASFEKLITGVILAFSFLLIVMMMALNVTKDLSGKAGVMATKFAGGNMAMKFGRVQVRGRAFHGAGNAIARSRIGGTSIGRAVVTGLDAGGGADYAKWQKGYTERGKMYDKRSTTQSERQKRADRKRMRVARESGSPEMLLAEDERQKKAQRAREERIARRREPGVIGRVAGKITGTTPMDREIAEEIGQLSAKAFNTALDHGKANYEKENHLTEKTATVTEVTRDLDKLNQAFTQAKADGLSTSAIESEIAVARNKLDTATNELKPVKEGLADMEKRRKKEGPREVGAKDIMDMLKKQSGGGESKKEGE